MFISACSTLIACGQSGPAPSTETPKSDVDAETGLTRDEIIRQYETLSSTSPESSDYSAVKDKLLSLKDEDLLKVLEYSIPHSSPNNTLGRNLIEMANDFKPEILSHFLEFSKSDPNPNFESLPYGPEALATVLKVFQSLGDSLPKEIEDSVDSLVNAFIEGHEPSLDYQPTLEAIGEYYLLRGDTQSMLDFCAKEDVPGSHLDQAFSNVFARFPEKSELAYSFLVERINIYKAKLLIPMGPVLFPSIVSVLESSAKSKRKGYHRTTYLGRPEVEELAKLIVGFGPDNYDKIDFLVSYNNLSLPNQQTFMVWEAASDCLNLIPDSERDEMISNYLLNGDPISQMNAARAVSISWYFGYHPSNQVKEALLAYIKITQDKPNREDIEVSLQDGYKLSAAYFDQFGSTYAQDALTWCK